MMVIACPVWPYVTVPMVCTPWSWPPAAYTTHQALSKISHPPNRCEASAPPPDWTGLVHISYMLNRCLENPKEKGVFAWSAPTTSQNVCRFFSAS